MSKTTIRKRIALTATTALFAGMLTVVAVPGASAINHFAVNTTGTNTPLNSSDVNELLVATLPNTGASAVVGGNAGTVSTKAGIDDTALSKGLLAKDASSGTAQTATVLAGGALSLYAGTSTAAAFFATGGTLSSGYAGATKTAYYNSTNTYVGFDEAGAASLYVASGVAVLWTAPTTAGSYTVRFLTGFATNSDGGSVEPTAANGLVPPTLSGSILVTVVAASAGGAYSATYSACNTRTNTSSTITGIDSTGSVSNGDSWAIDFTLKDAYNAALSAGNLVATATNGALINLGGAGTTPVAGTASTDVAFDTGASETLLVSQPTAGAPLTTTVTITFNGTTVCTKTVSIAGKVASLEVSSIQTQDLGASTHTTDLDESGRTSGQLFQVVAKDSAGNRIATSGLGSFSADSAALAAASPTVQAASIAHSATATSSTSKYSYSTGLYQCGVVAGSAKMKIKFTTTSTGEAITSPEFTLRCADDAETYTASWDKASYVQGEIATLTVSFKDSKGNAANNVVTPGAATFVTPMLTAISATGSASVLPNAAGVKTYTFTVGTASGMTAGTYTSVIDFTTLTGAGADKATPTYKLTTGGDTTSNADVLKSIVALIASINKQIQALQKLILKR